MIELLLYGFMWAILLKILCKWNPKGIGDDILEWFGK